MTTAQYQGVRGLRAFLKLDALASGGLGVLLAAAGGLLTDPLGLPTALLVPTGLFLVAYAGWLWYLATRPAVSPAAVRVVIAGNLLWIVASVTLVVAGWFSPTALGVGFVLAQAAAVAGFVAGQYAGLRRAGSGVA
jgi:hypothetical protein